MGRIAVPVSLLALASFLAPLAHAQQLTATELSLGAAAAVTHRSFGGAELALAHRPVADTRVALALAGGTVAERAAMRAQLTVQLLVNSAARSGPGLYAGMGAAFSARRSTPGQGFLAVLLGFEGAPGRKQAWYAELGFAGGVRVAAGWRMRWFPSWWRDR